jgi:2-polyprenyl-6-methoxyphenol hydroxylase-like FAD-dependent oxidoreductase
MNPEHSVTIVGAGIAGLAVAIALRQRGIGVQVLEQAPELQEIGAGLLLGTNACAVLERLGALQALLTDRSIAVPRWELSDWQGRLLSALHIPRSGESSISTRRSDLQWALMQRLPRDVVKLGCAVINAELTTEGVQLKLADGRQMTASKVIVTDGAHSMVRAALWPGREPQYCGYVGWRGLVDHVPRGWEVGRVSESWGYGRRFGIAPVGGGRTYWYASANVPAAHCRDRVSVAELRRDFAYWHHPVTEILSMMPEEDLLQHPIHDRRPAWHWQREEKVVLLGDAAHPLTPNLGQGAAMALEDAWELAALWGKPDAMTRFERRRRMRLLLLWAASRHIGKLIQWDHPALCWLRDTQMRLTPDTLHTAMMRRLLRYVPSEVARL